MIYYEDEVMVESPIETEETIWDEETEAYWIPLIPYDYAEHSLQMIAS